MYGVDFYYLPMWDFFLLIFFLGLFLLGCVFLAKLYCVICQGRGVPPVKTSEKKLKAFLGDLYLDAEMKFLDVGSGDGFLLEKIECHFPEARLTGVEKSWCAYRAAQKRRGKKGGHYDLILAGFEDINFGDYNVIYIYMLPYLMPELEIKCRAECKKGTVIYCNSFAFGGMDFDRKISVNSGKGEEFLYVYNF